MGLTFIKLFFIVLLGFIGLTGITLRFDNKDIEVKICDLEEGEEDLDLEDLDLEDLDASLEDIENLEEEEDELDEYIEALGYVNNN